FGKLDKKEERGKLRDRSLKHFDEQLTERIVFDINENKFVEEDKKLYFFKDETTYYFFLSHLFNKIYAIGSDTNYVFLGETQLKSKIIRYLSVDAHYFFNLLYLTLKREYRETFFKFIFLDNNKLNFENANLFLQNFNSKFNIFFPHSD